MATFDLTVGSGSGHSDSSGRKIFSVRKDYDAVAKPLAQSDIAQLIPIPAGTWVQLVRWEVLTVEGAARNFALGDGVNTSGFIATTSANILANGVSGPVALAEGAPNTLVGFSAGKYYGVADTLDLLAVTAGGLTGCKIRVTAIMLDVK